MSEKKYTQKQVLEANFHNQWGLSSETESLDVRKYFEAETSVDYKLADKLLGDLYGKKILDLGCGLGEASVYFALKGGSVAALDIAPAMLTCVERLAKKYKVEERIQVFEAPAEKIPFAAESFDLVFGGNVLHHVDIPKASREIKRVLKKGGKAVFIEPLGYNPVIQVYRMMAGDIRTKMEKPFYFKDIEILGRDFRGVKHIEHQFLTTLIFVWFFLGERLSPSKVRYWKRIIDKSEKYATAFRILFKIDKVVLKIPHLNKMCWSTVIQLCK